MKLMTKEIEKKLEKCPMYSKDGQGKNAEVVCKYFFPDANWTLYVLEGKKLKDGDWSMYGYVVCDFPEFGYFSLSWLENAVGPMGLNVERDRYFTPCKLGDLVDRITY